MNKGIRNIIILLILGSISNYIPTQLLFIYGVISGFIGMNLVEDIIKLFK